MAGTSLGFIKDPDDDRYFIAVQYVSPHEKWIPPGDGWLNVCTQSREIIPGHGLLLWRCADNKNDESEDLFSAAIHIGMSRKFALQLQCSSFTSAVKGGFFSGSNYKKIVAPFKKDGADIDDILILTGAQENTYKKRLEVLLPQLSQASMAGNDFAYFDIDENFNDKTGFAVFYEGIALVHGIKKVHPALLWFNIGTGDATIGNKEWTLLMSIEPISRIKDILSSEGLKSLAEQASDMWNKYTLREYLYTFQETIGKKVAECGVSSLLNMNHHIVILPRQVPDDWQYKDGRWYKAIREGSMPTGLELADLFFSI